MNFKKSFQMSPEMRTILPSANNKKPTKNFLVENIKHLREMQQQMEAARSALQDKAEKLQKPLRKKTPFTIKKFDDKNKLIPLTYSDEDLDDPIATTKEGQSSIAVQSCPQPTSNKQYSDQGVQTSPPSAGLEEGTASRSVRSATHSRSSTTVSPKTITNDDMSNAKERAINKMLKNSGVNFIELNRKKTVDSKRKTKDKPDPVRMPPNYQLGALPRYLKEKKETKKNEENSLGIDQLNSIKASHERPGHILLTDEERLEHLKIMKKCYEELLVQFNQLPIRSDSLKAKQKRADLEKQLENLENSMKIFSRERLYIKL